MALKDHSLDDKITAAAKAKFLDTGYTGASLWKIAEHVGVTAPCRFIDSGRSATQTAALQSSVSSRSIAVKRI